MSPLPDLDRGALTLADLAAMEYPGTAADKTKIAIQVYLWALDNLSTLPGTTLEVYPSLNDARQAVIEHLNQLSRS